MGERDGVPYAYTAPSGYREQARTLAERLLEAAAREGLREYYDPFSGAGMGARSFAWSALAVDLLDEQPPLLQLSSPGYSALA